MIKGYEGPTPKDDSMIGERILLDRSGGRFEYGTCTHDWYPEGKKERWITVENDDGEFFEMCVDANDGLPVI